ncbi:hypothetical protein MRX96_055713 [Rhipicephalus microplus]
MQFPRLHDASLKTANQKKARDAEETQGAIIRAPLRAKASRQLVRNAGGNGVRGETAPIRANRATCARHGRVERRARRRAVLLAAAPVLPLLLKYLRSYTDHFSRNHVIERETKPSGNDAGIT